MAKMYKPAHIAKKNKESVLKLNPFEIRVSRKKHNVLGQRVERNERGLPGVSKSRALQKRKKTLLKEYRNRTKTNNITDKRFGEDDNQLTHEEKMLQRQMRQAKKRHSKASIYNLEEEELTHFGQSLGDIGSFDDLQLSSDNDDEIDDTETHFGGFLKKKQPLEVDTRKEKTRREAIEEIVAKSKRHKYERQKEKEKVEELMDTIDEQWNEVKSLFAEHQKRPQIKDKLSVVDDFDIIVKELEGQPKAMAGERLIATDDNITKPEKDSLLNDTNESLLSNWHCMIEELGSLVNTSLNFSDVAKYSKICQTLIEYVRLSKRFIPELINFLTGLMQAFITDDEGISLYVFPPELQNSNSDHCLSLLSTTVQQVYQLSELWKCLPSYDVIFSPLYDSLTRLKEQLSMCNHQELKKSMMDCVSNIEHNQCQPKPVLQLLKRKPKSIKFFEPAIDDNYQPGRKKYSNRAVADKFKLKYKHKRELKGAIREIRKDNKFLAKERIKEQIEKDVARKKKVKQIYGWLQQERGEGRTEKFKKK